MSPFVCRLTVLTAVAASCLSAWAAPINLNSNLNLSLNPGSTGIWTLSATNQDNGVIAEGWNAFAVALQIIGDPGATGTVSIQGAINPEVNSVFSNPVVDPFNDPPLPVGGPIDVLPLNNGNFPAAINGTTAFTTVILGFSNSDDYVNWQSGQTYNLATVTWSASTDAIGSWTIYASNPINSFQNQPQTTWNFPGGGDNFFGNVPYVSGAPSTLQLGTISVVPEPHGLIVAGSAAVVALTGHQLRLRRRRNRLGGKQGLSV